MSFFRELGHFMLMGARAHAKWELDISNRILREPKRLAVLGLLLLPVILGGIAFAGDIAGALPSVLGGKNTYCPSFYTNLIFLASIGVGICAGLITGCIGAGGGFLTFPIFVYMLGVSSATTVGTDIFQIVFTAGYAGLSQYAIYGFIFYTLAMGMLLGSLLGIQIGSLVTKVVTGTTIRGFYAVAVMAGFVNRAAALPNKLGKMDVIKISSETGKFIENMGIYLFFIVISIFAIWVFGTFFKNIKQLKGEGVH